MDINISAETLALQRKHFSHLSDEEFRFMLQQVDGRQRTREKLPTFATINDWWYPVRLSCEQCSSELTAKYKAQLIVNHQFDTLIDLTAGYGVDTFFMSQSTKQAHYIERNHDLCQIAEHNFTITNRNIQIHNTTAEEFMADFQPTSINNIIYIDPARRNNNGNKVFLIEDCEPNIISLLPILVSKSKAVLIKLSPMLDIKATLRALDIPFEVHIVAIENEVKEILLFVYQFVHHINTSNQMNTPSRESVIPIHAVNLIRDTNLLGYQVQELVFSMEEEKLAQCKIYSSNLTHLTLEGAYIYEPNAAIIKSGAYKIVAQRLNLVKMAQHTHLYLSDKLIADFPGRVWQIITTSPKNFKDIRANITTRNYPLSSEQLRKKYKIKDSNTHTIIGARLADKPTLFLCKKI